MNPIVMAAVLIVLVGAFLFSARRRWALLQIGQPTWEPRIDRPGERLRNVWVLAIFQKKMRYYFWAGLAHNLIFLGFGVLLLRTLVLWGRGFDPAFNLFVLAPGTPLGAIYGFLKDIFALLVLLGTAVFVYYRTVNPQKRMTLSGEGLLILGIIVTMMVSDILYDGASLVLANRLALGNVEASALDAVRTITAPLPVASAELAFHPAEPAGSAAALVVSGLPTGALIALAHAGFWTHATLVLVFLNILPYSKHFHIITSIPNVFLGDLTPRGRLRPLAPSTEALMEKVEAASEQEDPTTARIGYARIDHFTWKDALDFYTCTECGRCTDNCPASLTGKKLSPKHFTLDLRGELLRHQDTAARGDVPSFKGLVPEVVDPDVLWACTTCRACEEQCPVSITYVDKIVQMRRHLVMMQGEFPAQLQKPFEGMEGNGNPWNLSRLDRAQWTEGLPIKTAAEHPTAEVFYWVGCAASYDDRAKKVARATAKLLLEAGVDFAILAEEETCTGDPARRAGNEYLFSMLAETNVATIQGYQAQGGAKKLVTTCPHCFNTLKNEYPDFGARFDVVHHTDFLLGLLAERKLVPKRAVERKVVYHDSCYLGRYNDIYDPPREVLRRIEGVRLVEVEGASRHKGLCCGAGGAQMWMEEQNDSRVNVKRTKQLLETEPDTLAAACPFCMTMLTDGIKAENREEPVADVAELLLLACETEAPSAATAPG